MRPTAVHTRAVSSLRAGRWSEAAAECQAILAEQPQDALAHRLLGIAEYHCGHAAEAITHLADAVEADPAEAHSYVDLATVLNAFGRAKEAEAASHAAMQLAPDLPEAAFQWGESLRKLGRSADAVDAFERVLQLRPGDAEAANQLGLAYQSLGRLEDASGAFEQALLASPSFVAAATNLASVSNALGRPVVAELAARRALSVDPRNSAAWCHLGTGLHSQRRTAEALAAFEHALHCDPHNAHSAFQLGVACESLDRLDEALNAYVRAMQSQPGFAAAANNLGTVLRSLGRIDESRQVLRQALAWQHDLAAAHSNLLVSEQYAPDVSPSRLAKVHGEWSEKYARSIGPIIAHRNSADPERRLRLGLVFADPGCQGLGHFLAHVLEALPQQSLDLVAYAQGRRTDSVAARLRAAVGQWVETDELTDTALDEQIRSDQIDILVDLSGHTAGNRLPVFTGKPAPVQISWLGSAGTTGIAEIDFLLADRFQVPPGTEADYRERILRLPNGCACFEPPTEAPPVGPLPAFVHGAVTFGSFSEPAAVNSSVLELWASILRRVPRSRLLLKSRGWDASTARERCVQSLERAGVTRTRVVLEGPSPRTVTLARHNDVDLALDPLPYSGAMTTCEALWMGVPVIAMPGQTYAGRHACGRLQQAGLADFVARDRGEYIDRAVQLAGNLPRLAAIRTALRERLRASPLCDRTQFVCDFETALRTAWREWCAQQAGRE